ITTRTSTTAISASFHASTMEEGELDVDFDGREVTYGFGELDELALASDNDPQKPGIRIPGRRHPAQHSALPDAAAESGLDGGEARQAPGGARRAAEGAGDRRQGSAGTEAMVEVAGLARRDIEPRTRTIQLSSAPAAKLWSRR